MGINTYNRIRDIKISMDDLRGKVYQAILEFDIANKNNIRINKKWKDKKLTAQEATAKYIFNALNTIEKEVDALDDKILELSFKYDSAIAAKLISEKGD